MNIRLYTIFLALMMITALPAYGFVPVDQAASSKLPPGHPVIGPNSPAVNPVPDQTLMQQTQDIVGQDRTVFQEQINLAPLRVLAIQSDDEIKTLDTWARQSLHDICGHNSINGEDPLYTLLDMTFRSEAWNDRNCIYIEALPLRQQIGTLVDAAEAQRILRQGTVSPSFLARSDVETMLNNDSNDSVLNSSINQVGVALTTYQQLFTQFDVVPPAASGSADENTWVTPYRLLPNIKSLLPSQMPADIQNAKPLPGYTLRQAASAVIGFRDLVDGWRDNNATDTNQAVEELAAYLPAINPAAYPSTLKRNVEIIYNRVFNGTIICVFLYLISLTLFLISAVGAAPAVRKPALAFFTLAVLMHASFMGVRWWLAGRIPIQNEFESVLGSALVGCVIGLVLEYWKKSSFFGLAMSFVGFLAMTACFVVPFVLGKDIGASISQVDGVLNTYWLYIHVNVVISSYALIGATFCLGVLYLCTKFYYYLHPVERQVQSRAAVLAGAGSSTLIDSGGSSGSSDVPDENLRRAEFLRQLDAANMVVLQMAFWFLGTGIIFGAVWADYSWGRPWGWDPKETFALVTWIVYLLIVHIRFVTPRYRPDWTAWLSTVGFAVMMFNWIGVNFFLVGLHSYA
ncbi:MAG TPA: cytochrome c biogenesis protein CcsA [Phycisphaerae bacterium]|nr:cytochrome c biogenesis protein CcsA [Phycisphaerae bacterium]